MAESGTPDKKETADGDTGPAAPGTEETVPAAAEPAAAEPSTEETTPAAGEPAAGEPAAAEPAAAEPAAAEPEAAEPEAAEPAAAEPAAAEPADEDATQAPAPVPAASGSGGEGGGRRNVVLAVLGTFLSIALVFLVIAGVLLTLEVRDNGDEDDDRKAALAAAQQAMVNLSSVKAETADQDVDRVLNSATGQFSAEFRNNREAFVEIVKQAQVNSSAEVDAAGIQGEERDGAYRVLVALTSTIKNTSAPEGEQRPFRMAVTMVNQDGDWLVDRVEYIP